MTTQWLVQTTNDGKVWKTWRVLVTKAKAVAVQKQLKRSRFLIDDTRVIREEDS